MSELRGLTREWSIELDPSFKSRVVDGDLQLVSPGPPARTIWIAVWSPPETQSIEKTIADIEADANPHPVQQFIEPGADADEQRFGSWYSETVGDRVQWGLYAYTVRRGSYVQAAFIGDEENDLAWALEAWRSLRWTALAE